VVLVSRADAEHKPRYAATRFDRKRDANAFAGRERRWLSEIVYGKRRQSSDSAVGASVAARLARRQQPVSATTQKLKEASIAEHLQLLANLLSNMLVHRVEAAQMRLERIHFLQSELLPSDPFHAAEHIQQPSSRRVALKAKEDCALPLIEHSLTVQNNSALNNEDFAGVGDLGEEYVAADPARTACSFCKRPSFLNNLLEEEVLRDDKKVVDPGRDVVIEQHKIGVIMGCEPLQHSSISSVGNSRAEAYFLALELELLLARTAVELGNWTIVWKSKEARCPAIGAEDFPARPVLSQHPSGLRSGSERSLGRFPEPQLQSTVPPSRST
jgi:hypothetical protein